MKTLLNRIIDGRHSKELTQKELARFINIKPTSYSRKETGNSPIYIHELLNINKILFPHLYICDPCFNEKTILKYLRIVREAKGLLQEDMGEMVGISRTSYAKIEAGQANLSITRFMKIQNILHPYLEVIVVDSTIYPSRRKNKKIDDEIVTEYSNIISSLDKSNEYEIMIIVLENMLKYLKGL